jgi:hypothetical protein
LKRRGFAEQEERWNCGKSTGIDSSVLKGKWKNRGRGDTFEVEVAMLAEIKNTRQIEDEGFRRWFTDSYFDLIVWYDEKGGIDGFQLCYDKVNKERALTWRQNKGYVHEKVDDGEGPGHVKMTPILMPDGAFSKDSIPRRFDRDSKEIDADIAEFVIKRILSFSF